jgi:hypothetical protein
LPVSYKWLDVKVNNGLLKAEIFENVNQVTFSIKEGNNGD